MSPTDSSLSTSSEINKDPNEEINIVLADDHPLVQDGIRTRLEEIQGLNVIGMADNGEDLIKIAEDLKPDIVITDISMPKINGLEATRLLTQKQPQIKILILTMHDNKEYMQNAIDSGAHGYMLKDQPADEMIEAVKNLYKGEKHFCSSATKVINNEQDKSKKLTGREQAILMELLNGFNNKQIAEKLSISVRTV